MAAKRISFDQKTDRVKRQRGYEEHKSNFIKADHWKLFPQFEALQLSNEWLQPLSHARASPQACAQSTLPTRQISTVID